MIGFEKFSPVLETFGQGWKDSQYGRYGGKVKASADNIHMREATVAPWR